MLKRYAAFVRGEKERHGRGGGSFFVAPKPFSEWPAYEFNTPSDSPFYLTDANISTMIIKIYERVKPWLYGDLQRRSPGEFASTDGTFKIATRTNFEGKCVVFLMGERADIIAWWACDDESWEQLYPGLLRLRDRLKRLNTLSHLRFWCVLAARLPPPTTHHSPLITHHSPPSLQVHRPLLRPV